MSRKPVGKYPGKTKPARSAREDVQLEPTVMLGHQVVRRCHAVKSDGSAQCKQPAREGFDVCRFHGAGSRKREAAGERRPVGRPPIHGLYSAKGLRDVQALMDQVRELQTDLDDTDEELVALKAVLWFLLEQAGSFKGKAEELEAVLAALSEAATAPPMESGLAPGDVRQLGRDIRTGHRLLNDLNSYTDRVVEAASRVIVMVKARAETRAKLAETRALEHFSKLALGVRNILWDLLDEEQLQVFEDRLRRELMLPNNLDLPGRDPDKLN